MIQDLMFPMTGTVGDANALAGAVALASRLEAHLAVIETVNLPVPMPSPWGITPDVMLSELYAELRAKGEANAAVLRRRLEQETIAHEVRLNEARFTEPPQAIALQARYADLSILTAASQQEPDDAAIIRGFFSALLFESGRPVLVIPPHHPIELPFLHAVVAWQPTREATRALHDAMPLLLAAGSVDVVTVDPLVSESRHGEQPGADIATHLARHGLKVNVVVRPRQQETVATALLRHAAESKANLLVAGGYGHSRLREWVLGGTTRELLQAIHLPILFSH